MIRKIKDFIGNIGFRLFIWAYFNSNEDDFYNEFKQ